MAFKGRHVRFVSFTIEVTPAGNANVMVVETDLHLNSKHPAYDAEAVSRLITDARNYAATHLDGVAHIRLISTHSADI
jgi:hypothetical protein